MKPHPIRLDTAAEWARCRRWFAAPVEQCACFEGHRGRCRREKELVTTKEDPR